MYKYLNHIYQRLLHLNNTFRKVIILVINSPGVRMRRINSKKQAGFESSMPDYSSNSSTILSKTAIARKYMKWVNYPCLFDTVSE